jgi:hypothetical protein
MGVNTDTSPVDVKDPGTDSATPRGSSVPGRRLASPMQLAAVERRGAGGVKLGLATPPRRVSTDC